MYTINIVAYIDLITIAVLISINEAYRLFFSLLIILSTIEFHFYL